MNGGSVSRIGSRGDTREMVRRLDEAIAPLRRWLEQKKFAGIEPHDALTSPLMKRTPLGRSRIMRLAALQALRRFPLNPRPVLGITPQRNAVSLGWALSAYCAIDDEPAVRQIEQVLAWLRELEIPGYSGACWGYYFDWQTRTDFKRGDLPIVVSTAFIGDGLLDVYERYGREDCLRWARSACDFIMHDLNRTIYEKGFVFSYSPEDHEQVYNASMLGAALLARVAGITGERELLEMARRAVDKVVHGQLHDGAWPYAVGDHRTFVDNFHTGYVLCGLKTYVNVSGDEAAREAMDRGWRFYRDSFFIDDRIPKYYYDEVYPIDSHAAAQSIVTLRTFGDLRTAWKVADWTIEKMQAHDGAFYYQIQRHYINRTKYLRWSSAWMLYALASLRNALIAAPPGGAR